MTNTLRNTVKTAEPPATDTGRKRSPRSTAKPTKTRAKRPPANPKQKASSTPDKPTTKRDQLAALLVRDEGATVDQMRDATGWLPHTVRAALTGLKKHGYSIDSDKVDGLRTYRAVTPR